MCLGTILNLQVAPFPGYPEETPRFAPLKSPPGLECTEEVGNLIMLELPKIVLFRLDKLVMIVLEVIFLVRVRQTAAEK